MTTVLEPTVTRPAADDPAAETWTLVERAQAGDMDAFGEIYRRYHLHVYNRVFGLVRRNGPLAEDITSTVFRRALTSIRTVRWQNRDIGAWLMTIARNLVIDHFKSAQARLEVLAGPGTTWATDDRLEHDDPDNSPEGHPDLLVLDHLTNETVRAALLELNPEQCEVLTLRFLQDLSVAETAAVMGKNQGAIKALQYRAVRPLSKLLPAGFEEGRHA